MADDDANPLTSDSDLLYEECNKAALDCEEKFRKIFNQDELLDLCKNAGLDKVFDIQTLMPLVQALSSSNLFISLKQKGGSLCWSLRPRDAARQMEKLNAEDRMIYVMIEEAHSNGVWVRNIKKRSNLTDQGLTKVTDKLCKLRLVKAVKNIRAPAQKTYMLHHLAPNDEVTGGSFYDGGELDESLVEDLGNVIVFHVRQAGWVEEKRRKTKRDATEAATIADDENAVRGTSPEETRGRKKRKISHGKDIEDAVSVRKARRHTHETHSHAYAQLSHPPQHKYPDTQDIHDFIVNNNFIRAAKASSFSVDEVQSIVNMLVWDGKLECVNNGYRTVRGVKQPTFSDHEKEEDPTGRKALEDPKRRGNALTEMPCGRCPVRNICGKGGPINPDSCVYFEQWLNLTLDGPGEKAAAEIEIVG